VEAEHGFRQSFWWDPNYTNNTSRYGQLKLMRGDFEGARDLLDRTMHHLQSSEILERLGLAEYMLGNKDAAVELWSIALERRPQQREYFAALVREAMK